MRVLFSALAFMLLIIPATMTQADNSAECFKRLDKDKIIGDTLTVFTNDNEIMKGISPILNASMSVLYMKSKSETGVTSNIVMPLEDINKITYRKPSNKRHVITLLGLGLGLTVGCIAADEAYSGSIEWSDFGTVFFGISISGIVGTLIGHNLGKNMTSEVTLECDQE